MMNYEVKTEKFTGPLDKLLQLIEEKHLEITQVSLAEVTTDFLSYVKTIGEKALPAILADFLVVAAKLVLIKSKALLPMLELSQEEEGEIHDLESRLRIYREFKVAGEHITKLWGKNKIAYGRPLFLSLGDSVIFYPPAALKLGDLSQAIKNLAISLQALLPETSKVKRAIITIEQKIEELLNRLKGGEASGRHSMKTMVKEKSREEVIVLFLAILHLLKDKMIFVEQGGHFEDIMIQKTQ